MAEDNLVNRNLGTMKGDLVTNTNPGNQLNSAAVAVAKNQEDDLFVSMYSKLTSKPNLWEL